jgi:hypothetical protein
VPVGDEHIRRLQIAVHDPPPVQRVERAQDAQRGLDRLAQRQRPVSQPPIERLATQQLHDDEDVAVDLPDVEDLADAGMVDAGRGPGLAPQARARVIAARGRADGLDRDLALQPRIARPVDLAHAAGSERREDLVDAKT